MSNAEGQRRPSGWLLLGALCLAAILTVILLWQGFRSHSDKPQPPGSEMQGKQAASMDSRSATATTDLPRKPAVIPADSAIAPAALAGSAGPASIAIRGIVLNEATRAPVDSAVVRIYSYGALPAMLEKATADGGKFQIEAPAAFRYGVRVEASGFRPYQDDSYAITRPAVDLEILITPALTLRGRVVDTQGAGIANALVRLREQNERMAGFPQEESGREGYRVGMGAGSREAFTDEQGNFLFPDIYREGRYLVESYHPGYTPLGMVSAAIPTESEAVLRMMPGRAVGSLSGTVVDSARRPVPGARIMLFDSGAGTYFQAQADAQGKYRFARLRERNYIVSCYAAGYLESRYYQKAIAIYSGRDSQLDFTLEPGRQIRGVVVGPKGEPVTQAQISLAAEDVQRPQTFQAGSTDGEGKFELSGLRDAQYRATVSHRDYLDLVASLRPSHQPQTLVLDSGLTLRASVSDPRGAPIRKFSLIFQSATSRSIKSFNLTTTDGQFEIRGLARDTYQLRLLTGNSTYSGSLDLPSSSEGLIILEPSLSAQSGREGRAANTLKFLRVR